MQTDYSAVTDQVVPKPYRCTGTKKCVVWPMVASSSSTPRTLQQRFRRMWSHPPFADRAQEWCISSRFHTNEHHRSLRLSIRKINHLTWFHNRNLLQCRKPSHTAQCLSAQQRRWVAERHHDRITTYCRYAAEYLRQPWCPNTSPKTHETSSRYIPTS